MYAQKRWIGNPFLLIYDTTACRDKNRMLRATGGKNDFSDQEEWKFVLKLLYLYNPLYKLLLAMTWLHFINLPSSGIPIAVIALSTKSMICRISFWNMTLKEVSRSAEFQQEINKPNLTVVKYYAGKKCSQHVRLKSFKN